MNYSLGSLITADNFTLIMIISANLPQRGRDVDEGLHRTSRNNLRALDSVAADVSRCTMSVYR